MNIEANPTANGRFVQVEIESGDAVTITVMLTPDEVNDLQAKLGSALDRLAR